jgi:hypothetical protein
MILNTENKEIKYLGRDFNSLRENLVTFSKTYFPNTFTDFSETSPAMLFIEMSSYVGDILSFYLDNQIQECFLQFSRQSNNIYNHAYIGGYKPKQTTVSCGDLSVFQQIPAFQDTDGTYKPNFNYGITIPELAVIRGDGAEQNFLTTNDVDFCYSSSIDPTEITVYEVDSNNNPVYFLLKKQVKVISGRISTIVRDFGEYEEFPTINIQNLDTVGIASIIDSNNNQYYEVDHLGQDTIFEKISNKSYKDPNKQQGPSDAPYILNTFRTERRFVTRFIRPGVLQIQFGAGRLADLSNEDVLPNQNNVGIGLPFRQDRLTTAYSPQNFIFTNTYGIAPVNTSLTINYIIGGGLTSNVPANTLNNIATTTLRFKNPSALNDAIANYVFQSVTCTNPNATVGGRGGDTLTEIRNNTVGNIGSQMRTVTLDDYITRVFSLPPEFGSVAKVYAEKPQLGDQQTSTIETISLYVLGYNRNGNLSNLTTTVKENITTYLNEFKMVGDTCEIRDAFIINIGVNFDIIVQPNFNNNLVLTNCINTLRDYFNILNRQINEPIQMRELFVILDRVDGVQTVSNIEIVNKSGVNDGYSQFGYDIDGATINRIIYPALDPSIFEVRYPGTDIKGRVVNF